MKKYRDSFNDERIQSLEQAMADGSVLMRFAAVAAGDQQVKKLLQVYLSRELVMRKRDLNHLLPIMRKNRVPEDLVWILTCAATSDSIAQVLLKAIGK